MLSLSRRSFLSIGGLGLLSMPQVLFAQEQGGTSHKAVINIFLGGGPTHQDMWDIKTDAPVEIRGPFQPISTIVAGIQIGECFPQIASIFGSSVETVEWVIIKLPFYFQVIPAIIILPIFLIIFFKKKRKKK